MQLYPKLSLLEWLLAALGVVVVAGIVWFGVLHPGDPLYVSALRDRARLSAEDRLVLTNTGMLLGEDGSTRSGTTLWCGRINEEVDRSVAAVTRHTRRGRPMLLGSALAWAPRSDAERRMIAQCSERLGPPALP
ncbi:hypothetical protein GGR12_000870 [Brevundimonas lenta]|uniref:Uncharacterized protein n=1 Tax=Brevundimonas lenta TaxID=424796 RepID=A0A7W6JBF5_9CAUL|nr:hypothetical protein [Brevundimonas lenta]